MDTADLTNAEWEEAFENMARTVRAPELRYCDCCNEYRHAAGGAEFEPARGLLQWRCADCLAEYWREQEESGEDLYVDDAAEED